MRRAALLVAFAPMLAAAEAPVAVVDNATGRLVLSELPPVLAAEEVRHELDSGLTNNLVLEVSVRDGDGRRLRGGASIGIRYELWDEVYLVTIAGADGAVERSRLESRAELLEWWRDLEVGVLADERLEVQRQWTAEVELSFVPFSQSEQREAQLWVERSLGGPRRTSSEPDPGLRTGPEANSRALSVLVATSIRRDAVLHYAWKVTATREQGGEDEDGG